MKRIIIFLFSVIMAMSCCNNQSPVEAVLQNIATRCSVRDYTPEPVSDAEIEILLKAAMAAPTAKNIQPWEFIVVKDTTVLRSLAGKLKYAKMLDKAPLAIVVLAKTVVANAEGEEVPNVFWQQDCSAATQNLLLAANALGLGAVWTNASDPQRSAIVCEALSIPSEYKPLCVVPIGHPAGELNIKDKWKPEKIHYEKF